MAVDILAIVSKAIFEDQALQGGELIGIGAVWEIDRYVSHAKAFTPLRDGGRIFLVTVRPPDEQLWFVGVLDSPIFDGTAWIAKPNTRPVTNISALRGTIMFSSGRGLSQGEGTLGMSLQTPRALTADSATEILAVVGGARPTRRQAPVVPAAAAEEKEEPPPVVETPAMRAERNARETALDDEVARSVVLFDKMQETYGLRLPESLGYAAGFIAGLQPQERAEIERDVGQLVGVGAWFASGSQGRRAPGDDERLRDRRANDPPEFVPVFALSSNGERWGLWYDDTDELPAGIARCKLVREAPEIEIDLWQPNLLIALRHHLSTAVSPTSALLEWLDNVLRREAAKVRERSTIRIAREGLIVGGGNPWLPDWVVPSDLVGRSSLVGRRAAYENDDPIVNEWIEIARNELRDGSPARALFLGRELHAFQKPQWRLACSELLIRAYTMLGRRPLADIVRVSYLHAEPLLPIYELPPPHPITAAAAGGDVDEILAALGEGDAAASVDDLEEALASAQTIEALDALLDHVDIAAGVRTDTALWRRIQMVFRGRKAKEVARHRKLALRMLERGTVNTRAFARILYSGEADLIAAASARVDLVSGEGRTTALHLAARSPAPPAVRVLLERGADPRAKNEEGRMAFDSAREAQIESPSDARASEILTMLQVAGGGMAKPPLPASDEIEYCEGDAVHHPKLGDGIVESVTGEGEEARLRIRFETETRNFLAKFVTPRSS